MTLEPEDTKVELNLGLVCHGRQCDLAKLRDIIRKEHPEIKIIFNTMSAEFLGIIKKSKMTEEQVKDIWR